MHFALTEEQAAIQDTALTFAKERIAPHAAEWDEKSHFPVDVIRETAALGMAAIYVPADHGGSGLSRLDGALIMEALAYGCPSDRGLHLDPQHGGVDGGQVRLRRPAQRVDAEARQHGLARRPTASPSPAPAPMPPRSRPRAKRSGSHYVLNGTKQFISGAGAADFYFVFARTGDEGANGISAFAVMKDTPGLSFGALEKKMGWNAQPTRQVIFDNCKVPAANRIGEEGHGFRFAMSGLDGGRINIGACSVGAAWAALDKARQYATERKAFGRAIADFQALQFKIADMATELEAARLMIYRAADAIDRADPQASMYSAMGKRIATDLGFAIVNDALQVHGGYGYLKDYGLEKLVRDLRVHQILEGTNEIMRVVIARKLLGGNRG